MHTIDLSRCAPAPRRSMLFATRIPKPRAIRRAATRGHVIIAFIDSGRVRFHDMLRRVHGCRSNHVAIWYIPQALFARKRADIEAECADGWHDRGGTLLSTFAASTVLP